MEMKKIATILYNLSLDMDYADYLEYAEAEIECIESELEILKENDCACLLQALENIALQNENMKMFYVGE